MAHPFDGVEGEIKARLMKIFYNGGDWISGSFRYTGETKTFNGTRLMKGAAVRASGTMLDAAEDLEYTLRGKWVDHPRWGIQFQFTSSSVVMGLNKDGVISFLSSGLIKGLGARKASAVWDKFGKDTYDVIEHHPERLCEVKGISEKVAAQIAESYQQASAYRQLREWLPSTISDHKTIQIYMAYGAKARKQLEMNPYCLIKDVDGIGFATADRIALDLGVAPSDPRRYKASVYQCLTEAGMNGHCFVYASELESATRSFLMKNTSEKGFTVDIRQVAECLKEMIADEELVIEPDGAVYKWNLYHAEVKCGEVIRAKMASYLKPVAKKDIDKAREDLEEEKEYTISDMQYQAVCTALSNPISIITGGPGTGKSTIIDLIVRSWCRHHPANQIALAAPTGKASRRMFDITGKPASTIHRLLSLTSAGNDSGDPNSEPRGKISHKLVIIDEASMLDITLAAKVLTSLSNEARVVFVGDIDQLPPIGPGNFFRDLVSSHRVPTVKLDLSFRQHGSIAINAQKINNGKTAKDYEQDDTFVWHNVGKEIIRDTVVREYLKAVQTFGVDNCVLITPMREKTSTAVNSLNAEIQEMLNPKARTTTVVSTSRGELRLHDRVMQITNDWENDICNGDMGRIITWNDEDKTAEILFDSGARKEYTVKQLFAQIVLAYAMTVHKMQGSECKAAVVACNSECSFMLHRNLLYTAVTRAKKLVVLCGDAKTIARCVHDCRPIVRNTRLTTRF